MMRFRRTLAVVLVGFAALAGAGCAGSSHALPTVSGKPGTDPVITIPNGNPDGRLVVKTLSDGHGRTVESKDFVVFHVEGKVWAGNRSVVDSYTSRQPQGLALSTAMPAWRRLAGVKVGSRVLMVVPPRYGYGAQGDPQANIMGSDTLVFVFDVLRAVPTDATANGKAVSYHPTGSQPSVSFGAKGPTIKVPKVAPPANFSATVLRRGTGPRVLNGQTVVVQEAGVVWRTGKEFESSWQRGFPQSFVLGAGQVLAGWEQGIGGRPVGTRLLLVIPPVMAYGQQGQAPDVDSGDTVVFVLDIVAAA
jgi:FKBP-type peptidyl-prolyl cis-trans isomerase